MRPPRSLRGTRSAAASLVVATLASGLVVVATPQSARAAETCGSAAGLSLGTGTDTRLDVEADQSTIKADALARVRKWRQDALDDTKVLWNGQTMKSYLASQNISEASYLNPQWSYDLERIAMQRTAELTVKWSHQRPNGEMTDISANGTNAMYEIIAASTGGMSIASAIDDQWAGEKADYTGNTGKETGHYRALIDPSQLSYGFGLTSGFATGETSPNASTNTATTGWSGTCEFRIPLLASDIASASMAPSTAVSGQTKAITATVTSKPLGSWPVDKGFTFAANGTLASASTNVATPAGSSLTAGTPGTSAITMASGDQTLALGDFTVEQRTISAIDPVTVVTASGTAPVLPATVTAHWNDDATTSEPVSWGSVPTTWQNRAGGTFTINGAVAGSSQTAVTVTVTPAGVTAVTAQDTSTPAGVAPTLPATATVTWSNGDTSSEPVTWDAVPAQSYAHPGSFTATGHLANGATVQDAVTVSNPVVTSVTSPQISTLTGVAPTLPPAVWVNWSDGTMTQAPVTWDGPTAAQYASAGTVTINGTATLMGGASRPASLTLVVQAPGFTPAEGTPPAATGLIGESTGDRAADVWALDDQGTLDFYRYVDGGQASGVQGGAVQGVGVRGAGLTQISYLAPITDQNGDDRADMLYRDQSDDSLWFAYNQGNGYLTKGIKVGSHWGGMDQIFYAGTMVAGSNQQYVLARRAADGSLWRYNLSSAGLSNGVQVGKGWSGMRVMLAPGTMFGDSAWDVVAIRGDGLMFGFESRNGLLTGRGEIGHGWGSMTNAFSPGDLTGDGRLDLMGQRSDGTLWAYANTPTGFSGLGQVGSGFAKYRLMA